MSSVLFLRPLHDCFIVVDYAFVSVFVDHLRHVFDWQSAKVLG